MSVDRDHIDPLDELLATARWPEISAGATARLREEYEALSGRRRSMAVWWIGAAAAVMVGIGVWVGGVRNGGGEHVVVVKNEPAAVPAENVVVRPANPAEMAVVLTAAARQQRRAAAREQVAVAPVAAVDVAAQLNAIAGKAGAAEALRVLKSAPGRERVVNELFARLDDPHVKIRLAAARALGYLDGPVVTERLAGMVERNTNRREALTALMQSQGREAREYLRRVELEGDAGAALRSAEAQVRSF